MSRLVLLMVLVLVACGGKRHRMEVPDGPPWDVVIIPGCPTMADGTPSLCQQRRAAWGAELFRRKEVKTLIASGSAAYTPYIEAETLAALMVAFGVPREHIVTETQSLHSDQNIAYSVVLADRLQLRSLAVASDATQAYSMCRFAARWGRPCKPLPLEEDAVATLLAQDRAPIVMQPLDHEAWVSAHREPRMARTKRYSSLPYYMGMALSSPFRRKPPPPPAPEPTFIPLPGAPTTAGP